MEMGRQRALVRQVIAALKQQEKGGSSASASKVVTKGILKRKKEGKDKHSHKKGTSPTVPLNLAMGLVKG